jgi:capsular exopolysaccharide synthesis family protein
MALAGDDVIILEGDLRRPSIGRYLHHDYLVGLTDVLIGRADLESALAGRGKLRVLPAGTVPPNPSELLGSEAMTELLAELARRCDTLMIDTPPGIPFADARVLAPRCAKTLLVVRANATRTSDVGSIVRALEAVGADLCGAVLNMARAGRRESRYSYRYYGSEAPALDDSAEIFDLRPNSRKTGQLR